MLANLATAAAPTFGLALIARDFGGLGAAIYAPTATGAGAVIVAPEHRGKALATILAGLTAATALGSPMGTGTVISDLAIGAERCCSYQL